MKKVSYFLVLFLINIFISTSIEVESKVVENFDSTSYIYDMQKQKLVYEISNVSFSENGIYIDGFAFIDRSQHYYNSNDRDVYIEIYNKNTKTSEYIQANTTAHNLTNQMDYAGVRYCNNNEYKKHYTNCNYYYNHVGFNITIPYDMFNQNHEYTFFLYVDAKNSNEQYFSPIYAPIGIDEYSKGGITYYLSSDIFTTKFQIYNQQVFVRDSNMDKFTKDGWYYYWNNNDKSYFACSDNTKKYNGVTYYHLKFLPTDKKLNNRKLVDPTTSSNNCGYIGSLNVYYVGDPLTLRMNTKSTDTTLESVYLESTFLNQSTKLCYEIDTDLNASNKYIIDVNYNGEVIKSYTSLASITSSCFNIDTIGMQHQDILTVNITVVDHINNSQYTSLDIPIIIMDETDIIIDNSFDDVIITIPVGNEVYYNKDMRVYYEYLELYFYPMIDFIDNSIHDYDGNFNEYYAGVKIPFEINYIYYNQRYENHLDDNISGKLMSNNLFELYNLEENLIKEETNGIYSFVPMEVCIENKTGIIKFDNTNSYECSNSLYTYMDLEDGIYNFSIILNDIGYFDYNLIYEYELKISGKLFSQGRGSGFYLHSFNNKFINYSIVNQEIDFTPIKKQTLLKEVN